MAKNHGTAITRESRTVRQSSTSTIITEVWRGDEDEILAKKAELYAAGWECEYTQDKNPKWKLTAILTTEVDADPDDPDVGTDNEEPTESWELLPSVMEQSIWESGRPLVQGVPTIVKENIELKLKNPGNNATLHPAKGTVMTGALLLAADRLYAIRRLGIEGKQINVPTLRRSVVVASTYTNLTWTTARQGKVLSTAKVKSLYGVPFAVGNLMPASFESNELQSIVEGSDSFSVWLAWYWGWLENYPSIQVVGTNQVQIAQSWTWGKWLVTNDGLPGLYDLEV